jgi:AraC family transcriptional regulator
MDARIECLTEKKLIGQHTRMSIADNKTGQLWGQFAPKMNEIRQKKSTDKISMQVYPAAYFDAFDLNLEFEKWAALEVNDFEHIPPGMDTFILREGLYAVFDYKGLPSDSSIYQYIFSVWLPSSPYQIADRPHFEILGDRYKNNDPNSEEEIWIPIEGN